MYICVFFFFFNDTATTEIYTLSLHDALPIYYDDGHRVRSVVGLADYAVPFAGTVSSMLLSWRKDPHRAELNRRRSEEHTSELQSRQYLVCRLLLEKKKNKNQPVIIRIQNNL